MTTLLDEIKAIIGDRGPITVEQYMQLAITHTEFGYYMNRDPFGATGDFTTAPEISQMFGELVGLWAAEVWSSMGSPRPVRLVELGPGRGTLMSDALRAARIAPLFREALDVWLMETSPILAAILAVAAAECVRTVVALQAVVACAARDRVVAWAADEDVVASAPVDDVVTATALDHVVSGCPLEGVVAGRARDDVCEPARWF